MGVRVTNKRTKSKGKFGKHLVSGLHHTQQGLAGLFLRLYGDDLRYCHDTRTWMYGTVIGG